jgi:hypothetical protein
VQTTPCRNGSFETKSPANAVYVVIDRARDKLAQR